MSRVVRGVLGLALVALLSGCIDLPTDGPVLDAQVAGEQSEDRVSSFDARHPQPGDSRLEVVKGFLEAMMAWPISTNVAKEYLTDDAAAEWSPDSTVIYSALAPPREEGSTVSYRMLDAALLDESGGWRGTLAGGRNKLDFQLTVEDGEFRIVNPMDALAVRNSWFQQRYRQASLYYFDPTAQVLVPEPVFVPVGQTFATNLVNALLAGPPPRLRDVVDTFIPAGLDAGLSVPVIEGIAALDLQGNDTQPTPAVAELMLAQLAATLSQEPSITALRVTIGGEEVDPPGAVGLYDLDSTAEFDPSATGSAGVLYGLQRGRVVSGSVGDLRVVDGPFGRGRERFASVAVAPVGDRIAGVTEDRTRVLVAPVRSPAGQGVVRALVEGGSDLAQPSWDASGRLWILDRGPDGARVLVSADGAGTREVRVPLVSGADADRLIVSRDGTRLIALVRRPGGDQVVAARVVLDSDSRGRVARVIESTVIRTLAGRRAIDVAWTEPAQIAVLSSVGGLFEVEAVSADGATLGVEAPPTRVTGRVTGLASEPYIETPVYAVTRDVLVDVPTGERFPVSRVRDLDFAG